MSDGEQGVNIQVEDFTEARLKEGEAFCHGVFFQQRKRLGVYNFFQ